MSNHNDYIEDIASASFYGGRSFRRTYTEDSLVRELTIGSEKLHERYRGQLESRLEERFNIRLKPRYIVNDIDDLVAPEHGALERINTTPIDVVHEIFSHLHPKDLLTLSRTTKALRKTLLTREARWVWKSALGLLYYRGLPGCPDDLTEIQYVSLLFDSHCQFCLVSPASEISYLYRIRCCGDCMKREFISGVELERQIPEEIIFHDPQTLFLHHIPRAVEHFPENSPLRSHFYAPIVKKMLLELDEVLKTNDDEVLKKWCSEKRELASIRNQHAERCAHYLDSRVFHRSAKPVLDPNWEQFLVFFLVSTLFVMVGGHHHIIGASGVSLAS
ncbi:hypothetical protein CVT24_004644 [Panaeolus cyanescens]|uniref:F-box domain-containing protein n=1 Tax=Panaeolus cyanescens TaxID=181874 RepID=A0A409YSK0_9AGAR|nr:hypothetical protein CVT24_004644 [Panaeolus cyanescens]